MDSFLALGRSASMAVQDEIMFVMQFSPVSVTSVLGSRLCKDSDKCQQ